jgi:phosphate uptake regulator
MIQFDNHAFKGVDESLRRLAELQQSMGTATLQLIALLEATLDAVTPDSLSDARAIDKTVNAAEQQVEATVAGMINKFTLVGEELRYTLGSIKTAGALERGADKIKNAIKWLERVEHPLAPASRTELATAMGALKAMIPLALEQLVDYHPGAARALLDHGATVQRSYRAILLQLQTHQSPDHKAALLLVAKNLEQTADMAVEVMKNCYFVHTGTKYDKSAEKIS